MRTLCSLYTFVRCGLRSGVSAAQLLFWQAQVYSLWPAPGSHHSVYNARWGDTSCEPPCEIRGAVDLWSRAYAPAYAALVTGVHLVGPFGVKLQAVWGLAARKDPNAAWLAQLQC
jgi:hypothetical protein